MAGKFSEPKYAPVKERTPKPVDWLSQNDSDYTSPYPCGVCRRMFTSRDELANHPHPKKAARA